MKDGQIKQYSFSVQLPADSNDPIINLGWVPNAVSADGFTFAQLVTNDGLVLPTGAMVDQIISQQGINVRAALWAVDPSLTDTVAQITGTATNLQAIPSDFFMLNVASSLYAYDLDLADGTVTVLRTAQAAGTLSATDNWLLCVSGNYAYNEDAAAFGRVVLASAGPTGNVSQDQALQVALPGEWTLTHAPAAATQATATRAGVANTRHVLKSLNFTLVGVAAIAAPISAVVRDGATGVGAILWEDKLFAPAAGSKDRVTLGGLNIVGTAGNAMTVEFVAGPGATNFEAVAATGVEASG